MEFNRQSKIYKEKYKTKGSRAYKILFTFLSIVFIFFSLNIFLPNTVPRQARILSLNKRTNILFLGIDQLLDPSNPKGELSWRGRSDTIIVVSCNPKNNTINILNIPRDTKIRINRHRVEKINFLNAIGGPKLTRKNLERLLGIEIDFYIVANLNNLSKIIDEVGGVNVDVPKKMHYSDRTAMLYIDLEPGMQHLNGNQAIQFVRFRQDGLGDIGRIQRQQEFVRSAIKKLLDPLIIAKLPSVIFKFKNTVLTNMNARDIIRVANFIKNVKSTNQNSAMLPGRFGNSEGASYWIPNKEETYELVEKFFKSDEKSSKKIKRIDNYKIKISVLNAAGKNEDLTYDLVKNLRDLGYNVITVSGYEEDIKKTKIYAQNANLNYAKQVKTDIDNIGEIIVGNLGPPESDITLLIGEDVTKVDFKVK